MNSPQMPISTRRHAKRNHRRKSAWIAAIVALLLSTAGPAWAQAATVFLDDGFEDDTVGTAPNSPTIGSWAITGGGVTVVNDVTPGAYAGANYLKIPRPDTANARAEAVIGTVTLGNTMTATFAFQYETTTTSSAAFEIYSGTTRRVAIYAEYDLSGDPYFRPTNFYSLNGDLSVQVNSSLPVTPGAWQTIKIEYTAGSTNVTLTVNGTSETLVGAVTAGTLDRVRFAAGNTNSIFYIDNEIRVEATTNVFLPPGYPILFQDNFQSDAATNVINLEDWDPVIGAGDIGGSWDIREGSTANNVPLCVQVYNQTVPDSQNDGIAGTNNYLRIYRGGSLNATGKPYATGWDPTITLNRVVQLDMLVWQEQLPAVPTPGYLQVMFGGIPQNSAQGSAWLNSVGASAVLSDGILADTVNLPDNQWLPVRIIANLSLTDTQEGLLPQTYSVSVDNVILTNNAPFRTSQNTVTAILVGYEGQNEHYDFIDDVTIRIVAPLTVSIATLPDQNQQLAFTGNPGSSYVVQTATNLTDWISISTNTADGITGQFIYSDLTATNYTQRFYRGVSQ